jgi:hypothetical protein
MLILAFGAGEQPWRRRIAWTVECATPVSAASSRGPQPVRWRAWQTRRSTSASVRRGEWCGRARAIQRPDTRHALPHRGIALAHRPVVRRGRRHGEGGGRLPLRQTVLSHQPNQLDPPSRSELAPNVLTHPGPPVFVDPWQDPQASGAARTTLLKRSQRPWARQPVPEMERDNRRLPEIPETTKAPHVQGLRESGARGTPSFRMLAPHRGSCARARTRDVVLFSRSRGDVDRADGRARRGSG